jgi:hypothetical protein
LGVSWFAPHGTINPENVKPKMSGMIERIMAENPSARLIVFGETTLGWYHAPYMNVDIGMRF